MDAPRQRLSVAALTLSALALAATAAGAAVVTAAITGADIVDGSLTGADLADGRLDGADNLVRVAAKQVEHGYRHGNGLHRLAQVSIDVPADGYLAITASTNASSPVLTDRITCLISVGGVAAESSTRVVEPDGDVARNTEEDCRTAVVEPVRAGHYFVAFLANLTTSASALDETSLDVMFIPFGADGEPPTDFTVT